MRSMKFICLCLTESSWELRVFELFFVAQFLQQKGGRRPKWPGLVDARGRDWLAEQKKMGGFR